MEEGLLLRLKDKGIFTGTMVSIIQVRSLFDIEEHNFVHFS